MKSLTVKISGGLGNQLFLYAAGYALAKRLNSTLKLDLSFFETHHDDSITNRNFLLNKFNIPKTEVVSDKQLFEELGRYEKIKSIVKKIKLLSIVFRFVINNPIANTFYKKLQIKKEHIYFQSAESYVLNSFFEDKNITYMDGTFISELYFKDVIDDIRSLFSLKETLSSTAEHNLQVIRSKEVSVSLHVRRGDYAAKHNVLLLNGLTSLDYYKKATDLVDAIYGNNVHYFIFSDDQHFVNENFNFLKNKTFVEGNVNYPHEDLYLMSQCNHHIIANSTFSWWGAWLNSNQDKTVIAPRWWFSREAMKTHNTMDVYPKDWITI